MAEVVLQWTMGNKKVFTRRFDVAEQAMNRGASVTVVKAKSRVFKKIG